MVSTLRKSSKICENTSEYSSYVVDVEVMYYGFSAVGSGMGGEEWEGVERGVGNRK